MNARPTPKAAAAILLIMGSLSWCHCVLRKEIMPYTGLFQANRGKLHIHDGKNKAPAPPFREARAPAFVFRCGAISCQRRRKQR
jgi:hypothetical protein